jgi:4,5-DOPA dioxygenase extradiol
VTTSRTHSFEVFRNPRLAEHLKAFDEWAADAVARGDVDALADYRLKGPAAGVAHPTADHFVPLLLALGASTSHGRHLGAGIDRFFVGTPPGRCRSHEVPRSSEPAGSTRW